MVNNLVRKQGVPALAYPTHDVSVSWECRLRIVKLDAQFMVSLEYPLQRHDITDERLIILRYEGDNLVPKKNSFSGIKFSPSATLLTVLGRNGSHRLRTLSLTLKEPCSVWYPKEPSSLHADFPKFLELARATGIDIVFDTKWLGSNFNEFQGIFNGSQEFARIPVLPQFTDLYQKADWPILNLIPCAQPGANALTKDLASVAIPSVEDTGPREPAQDVIFDDPPPYKQSKRSGPSPAPDIPISKRLRHSAHSPSPDCATPASQVSSTSTVPVDTFRLTVTSELEKVLPEVLSKYFRDMHASHSRSPSLSPSPPYTRISSTPARHGQTPSHRFTHRADIVRILNSFVTQSLANLFDPTFAQAFDRASDRALDQTLEQASELYNSASIQMEDYVADLRSDLAAASEDHKAALNEYCHQQSEEFAQHIREQKEEVEAQCHEAVLKAEDKLDMVKQALSTSRCLYSVNGRQSAPDKGRRAVSLPLLKEDDERIANE